MGLSLNNLDQDNNYLGGICKTYIDLLSEEETKIKFKNSSKN